MTYHVQKNTMPVTRAHIRATVIVGLGLFFDLFDVFLAGVLSTVLTASFVKCGRVAMAVCRRLIGRRDRMELAAASPGIAQVAGLRERGTPSFSGSPRRPVPQDDAHAFGVPDLSDRRLLRFWHDHPAGAGGEGIFGVIVIDLCDDHVSWLSHRRCPVRRRGRTHGTPATYRCLSAPDGCVWIRSRLCQNARWDHALWICIHCDQQYLLERLPYPAGRGLPHRSSRPGRRSDLWTEPAFKRGHALCPWSGFA